MALKCFFGTYSFPKPKAPEPDAGAQESVGEKIARAFGSTSPRETRNVHTVAENWSIAAETFEENAKEGERLECIHLVGDAI